MSWLNVAAVLGTIHRLQRPGVSTRRQAGLYVTTVTVQMSQSLDGCVLNVRRHVQLLATNRSRWRFVGVVLSVFSLMSFGAAGTGSLGLLNVARHSSISRCHDRSRSLLWFHSTFGGPSWPFDMSVDIIRPP